MAKDQTIINDGAKGSSFSLGGDGPDDVKKVKIGNNYVHLVSVGDTMVWNDFRLDDLPNQGDVWGSSSNKFRGYCGACFGGAVRVDRPSPDAGQSTQGIKMVYTLPYTSSVNHKWTAILSCDYNVKTKSSGYHYYSFEVFFNDNTKPLCQEVFQTDDSSILMRLLISSPFHNKAKDTFHLYFDCEADGNFIKKPQYIASNYRYNSPNTYIKKEKDIDCRPYLEIVSDPGVIYIGPNDSKRFTLSNYRYNFWARRWYNPTPYWT